MVGIVGGIGTGRSLEQRLGVRMAGRGEDLRGRPRLDHLAQVHDSQVVGDVADHGQVVGDEQVGDVHLFLQRLQQQEYLGLDRHVQRRSRFVEHHQGGLGLQKARAGGGGRVRG